MAIEIFGMPWAFSTGLGGGVGHELFVRMPWSRIGAVMVGILLVFALCMASSLGLGARGQGRWSNIHGRGLGGRAGRVVSGRTDLRPGGFWLVWSFGINRFDQWNLGTNWAQWDSVGYRGAW